MQIGIDVDGVLLNQNIKVNITNIDDNDYICISDFCKYKEGKSKADDIIRNWLRNRITLEFLGTWESIYNPYFNSVEFDGFRKIQNEENMVEHMHIKILHLNLHQQLVRYLNCI